MTTETPSKNTSSTDNKAIFGPLGKYAVIAVIMVSIIVTTAIMLDKQLNTVDAQIAEIEADIAKSNKDNSNTVEITAEAENTAVSIEVAPKTNATVETPTADILIMADTETVAVKTAAQNSAEQTSEVTSNKAEVNVEIASSTDTNEITQSSSTTNTNHNQFDMVIARDEARKARIDSLKLEQKNRMTEIFARIKALESQQLDRYKTSQNSQVSNLREQISRQQQMIEALILRNKDLYQLRAASAQRNQSNREQILNRI
jgi:hypothetical protein